MPARSTLTQHQHTKRRTTTNDGDGMEGIDRSIDRGRQRFSPFKLEVRRSLLPSCWGRDEERTHLTQRHLRRCRCPSVQFPFWALPKHHSPRAPPSTALPSFFHICRNGFSPTLVSPPRVIMAPSEQRRRRRSPLLRRLMTTKIREEAAKLMLLLIF